MSRQWRSDDTDTWVYKFGDGSDGALTISSNTTFSAANEGCSGTSGTTSVTLAAAGGFSNGDLVLIHQSRGTGVGNWELNKISSGGGGTSLTMESNLQNTYTDSGASQAQMVKLFQYSSVTVDATYTWSAADWDGSKGGLIAFLCNGTTTINGTISTVNKGHIGGVYARPIGDQGGGTAGAGTTNYPNNGSGGGGGRNDSGNQAAGGGGGGHGAAGSDGAFDATSPGEGGDAVGNASLTSLVFGGAGGGGTRGDGVTGTGGNGADSAGSIIVITNSLTGTGSINLNGSNGGNGTDEGSGGGGSAGGAGLFKAQTATFDNLTVTASAGSGGSGSGNGKNGGAGAVGRFHLDYSGSFSGTTTPTLDTTLDSTIVASSGGLANPIFMSSGGMGLG